MNQSVAEQGATLRCASHPAPELGDCCEHAGASAPTRALDEMRREVFDEFARARMPELLRFGHALAGSPHAAADLVQDALVGAMLAWGRLENQGDPEGYVRRIMVNRNISIWRRQRRETLVLDVPEGAGRRGAGPAEPAVRDLACGTASKHCRRGNEQSLSCATTKTSAKTRSPRPWAQLLALSRVSRRARSARCAATRRCSPKSMFL